MAQPIEQAPAWVRESLPSREEHEAQDAEARAIEAAIGAALNAGYRTADLAEGHEHRVGTKEMEAAIESRITTAGSQEPAARS